MDRSAMHLLFAIGFIGLVATAAATYLVQESHRWGATYHERIVKGEVTLEDQLADMQKRRARQRQAMQTWREREEARKEAAAAAERRGEIAVYALLVVLIIGLIGLRLAMWHAGQQAAAQAEEPAVS